MYNGGKLIAEYTGTKRVDYLYDENGMLYGFIYNNAKYFYIRDTLQNILGIVDANGNAVVHYNYTAYGECKANTGSKATTIGVINSFRYKGYYFDAETEFFYCNARYYSPEFCRFISPDSAQYLEPENVNGLNLYAYCGNDPINYADPSGHMPKWAKWVIGGAVIAGLTIATVATGGAAGGVAGFVLAEALKGAVVGAVSGAIVNGTINGISSAIDGDGFEAGFAEGAANGFMSGAVIGGITGAISSGVQVYNASRESLNKWR